MMHSYSPTPRQLAVPAIGCPQVIPIGRTVFDLAFPDCSTATWIAKSCETDDQHDDLAQPLGRTPWLSVRV